MPNSDMTKFQQFSEDVAKGKHDFSTHVFKVMLTNTAPDAAANKVKADITEIAPGNGYTAGGAATAITVTRSGETTTVTGADVVFTGAGGAMAAARYAVLYNDTQTSPVKPLVGYYDYGSSQVNGDGETFTVDFNDALGILTIGAPA